MAHRFLEKRDISSKNVDLNKNLIYRTWITLNSDYGMDDHKFQI